MSGPVYHFHVARAARVRHGLAGELFGSTANLVLTDLGSVRRLAASMGVRAGDLNAMGLVDEILHVVTRRYLEQAAPGAFGRALAHLEARLGRTTLDRALEAFVAEFPAAPVGHGLPPAEWLAGSTAGVPHREICLEEMLHLRLANANPAFTPFRELFDETLLASSTPYAAVLDELAASLRGEPPFGPDREDLVTLLRSPAVAVPHSLAGQLDYLRRKLGHLIGDLLLRLLTGLDVIREHERLGLLLGGGPGPAEVLSYDADRDEREAFSADREWMPQAVMLAKNALVWLDQLSRSHGRPIRRLDEIPDDELDLLARRGFSALWLIGVWERSPASRAIKRRMGNPEAEPSAYSLFDYAIAASLGGEEALGNLRDRAWRRGIRLASDMVPNHTGIDSRWVVEHPERFLAWPHAEPPFPSYSFGGPDLSSDPRVGIYLEDHYWDRTDAAVVFKRVDRATGECRYLYHGNDGTHLPWNDTAQLDFLREDTREAVIDAILRVARSFSIIRFDAAMTLTRRHFRRLWFPEPGRGGDIPSRAGAGVSREEFDRRMPREFWRDVVDRAAREAPDTLLLAEAFWLLEGYFVRTLGMHRVYNSAFMNMLKTEDNAGYRLTLRNTLEFDPGVLERFVNFMSNPDEQTAIEQFGTGDKYFGVCTMLATLPGLPMFAHGQIEGLREKYGMEYARAYRDERPDGGLVAHHERRIFPLLRRRRQFARAERFLLYDLFAPEGWVNEDVFAYSNAEAGERSLVLYNNSPRPARGWIRESAAYAERTPGGKRLARRTLAEGLALEAGERRYVTFRDLVGGLEYVRGCRVLAEQGLAVDLGPYGCQVFLDFADVTDDGSWSRLCDELAGRGVPSLARARRELDLRPVREAFAAFLYTGSAEAFLRAAAARAPEAFDVGDALERFRASEAGSRVAEGRPAARRVAVAARALLRPWSLLRAAGPTAAAWIADWMLDGPVQDHLRGLGAPPEDVAAAVAILGVLLRHPEWLSEKPPAGSLLSSPESAPEIESLLGVNSYGGTRWFSRERLDLLADALALTAAAASRTGTAASRAFTSARRMKAAGEASGWRWDDFRERWVALSRRTTRAVRPSEPTAERPSQRGAASRKPRRRTVSRKPTSPPGG